MVAVESSSAREITRLFGHTTVVLGLLTTVYFVIPLRLRPDVSVLTRAAVAVVIATAAVLYLRWRRDRPLSPAYARIELLLVVLYGLVLAFGLIYTFIATYAPAQFSGLNDRVDALYFSVTIIATVGFGDIHARDTAAQLVVTVHMLINLIYIGTAVRLLIAAKPPTR